MFSPPVDPVCPSGGMILPLPPDVFIASDLPAQPHLQGGDVLGQRCPIFNRVPSPRLLSVSPAALGARTEFWRLPSGPFPRFGVQIVPFWWTASQPVRVAGPTPLGISGDGPLPSPGCHCVPTFDQESAFLKCSVSHMLR